MALSAKLRILPSRSASYTHYVPGLRKVRLASAIRSTRWSTWNGGPRSVPITAQPTFCTLRSAKAAFSSRIECTYGRGVNLYSGSGWGTPKSLDRIVHETRFRKRVLSAYPLNPLQRQSVREALGKLRRAFAADVLHRLRTGSRVRFSLLARQARTDPASYLELPRHVLSALTRRTA